jgi:hypothetical protein
LALVEAKIGNFADFANIAVVVDIKMFRKTSISAKKPFTAIGGAK